MQSLVALGQMLKIQYPDVYDHISDYEVGRRAKEEYPDVYSGFGDALVKGETVRQIEARRLLPNRGLFTSDAAAAANMRHRQEEVNALRAICEQERLEQQAELNYRFMPERVAREVEKERIVHQQWLYGQELARLQYNTDIEHTRQAAAHGYDLLTWRELKREEGLAQVRVAEEQAKHDMRMDEKREKSRLRIERKQAKHEMRMGEIKLESSLRENEEEGKQRRRIEAYHTEKAIDTMYKLDEVRNAVEWAIRSKMLSSHEEISILYKVMDRMYDEIEAIEGSRRHPGTKHNMIASRQRYINRLEEEIHGRQRLLEDDHWEDVRGGNHDSYTPEHPRQAVGESAFQVSTYKPWYESGR